MASKFKGDFVINDIENISDQYDKVVDQVPISLAIKGPPTISNRSVAYCVSKGGDPGTIIQSTS